MQDLFTPIVKEKTKEDFILERANRVVEINALVRDFLIQKVREAFNIVQNPNMIIEEVMMTEPQESPFGVTTQDILDCLENGGISTLKLFQSSGALQDFLVFTTNGSYQRLIPKPFSVVDGKIVVPEPEVLPEEEIIN